MPTILDFMTAGHKSCDDEFARAEKAVLDTRWDEAAGAFNLFRADMAQHFRMEEDALFPALQAAGGPASPVQMMCMEHAQMNDLLEQMAAAVKEKNAQSYSGIAETLLITLQQHNYKEEQILYPIADQILTPRRDTVLAAMQAA